MKNVNLINKLEFLGEKTKKPQKTLNPPNLTRKTAATGCLPILNQFKYSKGSFKKRIMLLYHFARFNGLAIPLEGSIGSRIYYHCCPRLVPTDRLK